MILIPRLINKFVKHSQLEISLFPKRQKGNKMSNENLDVEKLLASTEAIYSRDALSLALPFCRSAPLSPLLPRVLARWCPLSLSERETGAATVGNADDARSGSYRVQCWCSMRGECARRCSTSARVLSRSYESVFRLCIVVKRFRLGARNP